VRLVYKQEAVASQGMGLSSFSRTVFQHTVHRRQCTAITPKYAWRRIRQIWSYNQWLGYNI